MTNTEVAVLTEQVKTVGEDVREILTALKGSDSKPGVILDVDRLKQNDARRTWLLRTLIGAIVVLGLQAVATQFGWF